MVDLLVQRWVYKETALTIKSDDARAIDAAVEAALRARQEVERYAVTYPEFRWSLEPVELEGEHPRVIELMLRAGKLARVGPFAAVAGAISQIAMEAALEQGARNVLVENGGDIAIAGDRDFIVGVYAGTASTFSKLGFLIKSARLPLGICTSSGSIGHSISFGDADATVVFAREASVADAAATSVANSVRGSDTRQSILDGLNRASRIREIEGCLIIRGEHVGVWGEVPEIITFDERSPVPVGGGVVPGIKS